MSIDDFNVFAACGKSQICKITKVERYRYLSMIYGFIVNIFKSSIKFIHFFETASICNDIVPELALRDELRPFGIIYSK